MNHRYFAQLLIIISLLTASCADDGPAGPAGPAGATGATGAAGHTGATGPTGTANVIYSGWFKPSTYTSVTTFGLINYFYNQPVPAITQDILDKGVVLVYGKLIGYHPLIWPRDQVGQLPITLLYLTSTTSTTTQVDTWSSRITLGNIMINFTNSENLYSSVTNTHEFRYVVVPGGVAAATGRSSDLITRLQSMSYREAMAELGIPE